MFGSIIIDYIQYLYGTHTVAKSTNIACINVGVYCDHHHHQYLVWFSDSVCCKLQQNRCNKSDSNPNGCLIQLEQVDLMMANIA